MPRRRWIGSQQALALVKAINWIIENVEVEFNKTSDKYEMYDDPRNLPTDMLEPFEEDREVYGEEVKASLLATYKKLEAVYVEWEDYGKDIMYLKVWLAKDSYETCVMLKLVPSIKFRGGYNISKYTVDVYDNNIESPKKVLQFIAI